MILSRARFLIHTIWSLRSGTPDTILRKPRYNLIPRLLLSKWAAIAQSVNFADFRFQRQCVSSGKDTDFSVFSRALFLLREDNH
jgi:hypothetical protein